MGYSFPMRMLNVQWTGVGLLLLGSSFFLLLHLSTISSTDRVLFDFRTLRDAVKGVQKPVQSTPYTEYEYKDEKLSSLLQSNCVDDYKVPNIVHYVWLNKTFLAFHEYVSMLSASKFVKPCYILLHGDTIPGGKWWDLLLSQVHNVIHVKRKPPKEIFGRKLGFIEHGADVLRLQIIMEYGGIYADTDLYFLRSFDPLRNISLTLSRENDEKVANSLIVGMKNAPFLKIWYLNYHAYNSKSFVENSVVIGSKLHRIFPGLVHIEPDMVMFGSSYESVFVKNIDWKKSRYSVHLFARFGNTKMDDLSDINKVNNSFGKLSRYVIYGSKNIIPY